LFTLFCFQSHYGQFAAKSGPPVHLASHLKITALVSAKNPRYLTGGLRLWKRREQAAGDADARHNNRTSHLTPNSPYYTVLLALLKPLAE